MYLISRSHEIFLYIYFYLFEKERDANSHTIPLNSTHPQAHPYKTLTHQTMKIVSLLHIDKIANTKNTNNLDFDQNSLNKLNICEDWKLVDGTQEREQKKVLGLIFKKFYILIMISLRKVKKENIFFIFTIVYVIAFVISNVDMLHGNV